MGAGLIKNIIIGIILVILAFVVGSMAAEGARDSLMTLGAIVGGFVLLYMGKNCWWLIFVLPPVLSILPLGALDNIPFAYSICLVVLVYWLILRTMGYVKITWHGVIWMDLMTLALFLYFAYTYYCHPVELMIFSDYETEYVGGKEYVFCIAAAICYLVLSIVPCSLESLNKVLKWALIAQIAVAISYFAYRYNVGLSRLGRIVYMALACKYSLVGLILAPWKLLILLFALSLTLYGQREVLIGAAFTYYGISFIKRQVILLLMATGLAIGFLTYLSSQDVLLLLPHRIQRTLYILPWMNIDKEVAKGAQHSAEWRVVMWKWAMDPRTRYIKDYVWGDGFGQSMKLMRLNTIQANRGQMQVGEQEFFAETGVWHSGVFTALHRVGFVGLGMIVLWDLFAIFLIIRVCMHLDKRKQGFYLMYHSTPFIGSVFVYFISAGTIVFFFSQFHLVAMAKIAYSQAIKTRIMPQLFTRQRYVPLAIREMEAPFEQPQLAK